MFRPYPKPIKKEKKAKNFIKPKKAKSALSKAEYKLWEVFSIFIRLRDTNSDGVGKCYTCTRYIFWRDGDAGHGAGRQHKATKYNETNNNLQCKHCNGFEGGMRDEYKIQMDKKYGAGSWDLMQIASKKTCKRGIFEIEAMRMYYLNQIKILLDGKIPEIKTDVMHQLKMN